MFGKFSDKSVLKKIHKYYDIEGWLTENEAIGLYTTANILARNATIVEIGSWQGKSTYCLAKGIKSGKVYAIDPFNADSGSDMLSKNEYAEKGKIDLLEVFKKNTGGNDVKKKIVIKKGYSAEFYNDFDKINFLFLDGDHSIEGCKADFDWYAAKIIKGGFIAFHDYYEVRNELGPTYVVKNIVLKSGKFTFFKQYDSLWIARKIV